MNKGDLASCINGEGNKKPRRRRGAFWLIRLFRKFPIVKSTIIRIPFDGNLIRLPCL